MKANTVVSVVALALFSIAACSTDKAGREEPMTPKSATTAAAAAPGDTAAPAAAAATPATPAATPASAILGKPQAPVDIQAEVTGQLAKLRVRFLQAGAHVSVTVSGVDGLGLRGAPALAEGLSVAAGDARTWDVPLAPGPGQGLLAVQVRGTFAAGERTATHAFPVGTPSAEQLRAKDPATMVGGERVKLMEAGEKK